MAFGQASGPPATARQLAELLELVRAAGHDDFKDARGPMGFTQRQAGGRFTREEADGLIELLRAEGEAAPPQAEPAPSDGGFVLRRAPAEQLAGELRRRGWTVIAP